MLTRHDTLPSNKDIQRLQALLESADAGSVTLDAEIASVFHPRQNLLKKGGDLFWRKNTDDGPMFEPVPTYTRSLDARLPRESADDIKMSGKHSTRWHASCDGIGSVDAATEALARRSLALELILKSRLTKQGNPASRKTQVRDDRLPPVAAAEAPPAKEDHRDIVIAAMANEIKRISSAPNYTKIDSPDGEIFSTGRHNPHKRVPTSPRSIQAESILLSRLIEVWVREENPSKKSVQDMERTYRRFVEINGDMPADQVRKVHVRELLIRVRDMPRLMPYELKNHTIAFGVEWPYAPGNSEDYAHHGGLSSHFTQHIVQLGFPARLHEF